MTYITSLATTQGVVIRLLLDIRHPRLPGFLAEHVL